MRIVLFSLALQTPAGFCFIVVASSGAAIQEIPAATPQCHTYTDEAHYYKRVKRYSPQNMSNQAAALLRQKTKGPKSM